MIEIGDNLAMVIVVGFAILVWAYILNRKIT